MNAKVLFSFYNDIFMVHRVYLKPDFNQAEKDLDLLRISDTGDRKNWGMQICEVYGREDVLSKTTKKEEQL